MIDVIGWILGLLWDMFIGPVLDIFVSHWALYASVIVASYETELAVRQLPDGRWPR